MRLRPTDFGPTLDEARRAGRLVSIRRGGAVAGSLLSLANYARSERIEVVHGTEKPRDALYGVLVGKMARAKTIVHLHVACDDWISRKTQWALRHADAIIAISEFVARTIVAAGHAPEKVRIVHNALDVGKWDPTIDGRPNRRALGIPDDAPTVGIISRLFKWKGHAYLLEAMAQVRQSVPDAHLVIVGEDDLRGSPDGRSFRAELEAQAHRLGLTDRVHFTGFRTDIPQLMAALDVFVHPSWEEPFGMVFLEAMAMGKPVVAWNSGAAPEVILHNETGLLATRPSVPSLAQAIVTLLSDPARSRHMGEAGRRRVEEVFSARRMAEVTADVYRALRGQEPHAQVQSPLRAGGAQRQAS